MADLTAERARELLAYDPATGELRWRSDCWTGRYGRQLNARSGDVAGHPAKGGCRVGVDGRSYLAHRVAWLITHGRWPSRQIDHANGNPEDNRLANLREATASQNQCNQGLGRNNTTGFKGVTRYRDGRWAARIKRDGREHFLGYFNTPEDAHAAYCAAATRLHGDFANPGGGAHAR